MSNRDWYRSKTWSDEDKEAFFARLKRSRKPFHKAQYIRIQALQLEEAGLVHEAISLLEMLVAEWPVRSQLATAHHQRGRCLAALGRHDEALQAYREAFAAQRAAPGFKTFAHLDFGELIVSLQRHDLFDDVLDRFAEFAGYERLPVLAYRLFTSLALIHESRRDLASAKRYACEALEAAAKTESPFRYHRKLGLVGEQSSDIEGRLRRLASSTH